MKENFQVFNAEHGMILLISVVCILAILIVGRKIPQKTEYFYRLLLGGLLWGQEIVLYSYRYSEGSLSLSEHLPLHMCSISVLLIPIMLYKKHKFLSNVLYFWGMGGATQALLTPTVGADTSSFLFYQFFFSHSLIVAGVLYPIIVLSYRIDKEEFFQAIGATIFILPFVGLINWMVGGNYFYLAHKPDADTLLNVLGPWPLYIIPLVMIGILIFGILYLPFPFWRSVKNTPDQ